MTNKFQQNLPEYLKAADVLTFFDEKIKDRRLRPDLLTAESVEVVCGLLGSIVAEKRIPPSSVTPTAILAAADTLETLMRDGEANLVGFATARKSFVVVVAYLRAEAGTGW